jgi:hypothetical protein
VVTGECVDWVSLYLQGPSLLIEDKEQSKLHFPKQLLFPGKEWENHDLFMISTIVIALVLNWRNLPLSIRLLAASVGRPKHAIKVVDEMEIK